MKKDSQTRASDTPNALITLRAAAEILGTKAGPVHRLCEAGELSVYSIPNSKAWMVPLADVEAFAQAVREGTKSLHPSKWSGVHETWCNDHQDDGEPDDSWCCSAETTIGGVTVYLSQAYDTSAAVTLVFRDGNDDEEAFRMLQLDQAEALGSALLKLKNQATPPRPIAERSLSAIENISSMFGLTVQDLADEIGLDLATATYEDGDRLALHLGATLSKREMTPEANAQALRDAEQYVERCRADVDGVVL